MENFPLQEYEFVTDTEAKSIEETAEEIGKIVIISAGIGKVIKVAVGAAVALSLN